MNKSKYFFITLIALLLVVIGLQLFLQKKVTFNKNTSSDTLDDSEPETKNALADVVTEPEVEFLNEE